MTKNNQNQDSKLEVYELAVLIDPKLSEDKAADKSAKLGEILAQGSGAVLSNGEARMRNLAYEITTRFEGKRRDYTRAYFNWIKFEQDPANLPGIEAAINADKDVIRSLIIKTTREDYVTTLTDEFDPEDEDFADAGDEEVDEDEGTESEEDSATGEDEE